MNEKGLTLIEILASIVILSIIIISLLSFFVQSSRSTNVSKSIMNATYIAQTTMEEMYSVITATKSINELSKPATYNEIVKTANQVVYQKNVSNHSVTVELTPYTVDASLVNLKVKVNKDTKQEAQMEMLVSWKKE
ncbi:prepilin-type N-terminal cleavage/methylation domain-containing protein [Neobacillus sp. 3P2-tot-E-2]|uniref:prepilin-type N-terminal cleavage/methylation domain-containing protein n=1 Tax=Neobacillus sp. 3P2-tot-E-2 TaxID=3132212 RepID=UPI00399F76D9